MTKDDDSDNDNDSKDDKCHYDDNDDKDNDKDDKIRLISYLVQSREEKKSLLKPF